MNKSLCFILFIVGPSIGMIAQKPGPTVLSLFKPCGLDGLHKDMRDAKARGAGTPMDGVVAPYLSIRENPACFAELLLDGFAAKQGFLDFVKALEARRTDKQAGSAAGTGGTSSLVSKGTVAQALSLAAEYGALTESVNKQVVTLQGSLEGPFAALVRASLFQYCPTDPESVELRDRVQDKSCLNRTGLRFLRRISYGVSFDTSLNSQNVTATSSGTGQPVTFTANRHQITAVTGRFILWSTRDADSDVFKKTWRTALHPDANSTAKPAAGLASLQTAGSNLLHSLQRLKDKIDMSQPEIVAWSKGALIALADEAARNTTDAVIDQVWLTQAAKFTAIVKRLYPEISANSADFLQKSELYRLAQDEFVEGMATKPVLTLEYNNNRPVAKTPTSTFRIIFDKGVGKKVSVVANGAFTIFDGNQPGSPAGVSRFRDAQFGLQVQRDLGSLSAIGAAALAGSYYFQHQSSADLLTVTPGNPVPGVTFIGFPSTATTVFGQKGDIHVAQARLVLGAGQTSTRFPIAVSWSNRTDLIAKPTWRAQVGVSYDLDALFAK